MKDFNACRFTVIAKLNILMKAPALISVSKLLVSVWWPLNPMMLARVILSQQHHQHDDIIRLNDNRGGETLVMLQPVS